MRLELPSGVGFDVDRNLATLAFEAEECVRNAPDLGGFALRVDKPARKALQLSFHVAGAEASGQLPREYMDTALHGPLVQAAIVHAEGFGSAAVDELLEQTHDCLRRRGLPARLPLATQLGPWQQDYRQHIGEYRAGNPAPWLEFFFEVCIAAVAHLVTLEKQLTSLQESWLKRYENYRAIEGRQRALREDATEVLLMQLIPQIPFLTAQRVTDELGVSATAAKRALEDLKSANILWPGKPEKYGAQTYVSDEIMGLIYAGVIVN